MVLPFPHAQLLKWALAIFCFTLPFVLAAEMREFLPAIMLLASIAFSKTLRSSMGMFSMRLFRLEASSAAKLAFVASMAAISSNFWSSARGHALQDLLSALWNQNGETAQQNA